MSIAPGTAFPGHGSELGSPQLSGLARHLAVVAYWHPVRQSKAASEPDAKRASARVSRRRPWPTRRSSKPISLFYSYSHKDEDLRLKLETHLAALRRGGLIAEWHDRKLEPGDAWKDEIDRHLTSADIVLLLVSSDFIASDYCWGEEMTKALARHGRGEARVIPVILRHCHWRSTPLASLQAVPRGREADQVLAGRGRSLRRRGGRDRTLGPDSAPEGGGEQRGSARPTASQPAGESRRQVIDEPMTSAIDSALRNSAVLRRPVGEPGTVFRDIDAPWCPELVVIPAGSFVMGSPDDEEGRGQRRGAAARVTFAQAFALGRYPVTFEEYDQFCVETGGSSRPIRAGAAAGGR